MAIFSTHHVLAVACGAVSGFSLALTGAGGSTLAVPLLLYVVGMKDVHLAIGTSALAVSLNSFINVIPHARDGHVHWRAAFIFSAAGVLGAFAASELGKWVNGHALVGFFAVLVMVVAVFMLRPRKKAATDEKWIPPEKLNARLSGTGLGAGAIAGFFGVGGGFMIVPGLMMAARMPIIDAIGTSLFGVGCFGLTTALNYARSGQLDWIVAGEFILGGIAGGWGGAILARHLSAKRGVLNVIFAAVIFAIGVYMLIRTYA